MDLDFPEECVRAPCLQMQERDRVSPVACHQSQYRSGYIAVGSSIVWDLAAMQIASHVHLNAMTMPTLEVYRLGAPCRDSTRSPLRIACVMSVHDREYPPMPVFPVPIFSFDHGALAI